jgi:ribosomal peptide maturation radical SAM protein 1
MRMISSNQSRLIKAVLPAQGERAPVALVTTPFGSILSPSIQLGLLKAVLRQHGIVATVYNLNIPFARLIGYARYKILAEFRDLLLGEWIFSEAAFGPRKDDKVFFREFPEVGKLLKTLGWTRKDLVELKTKIATTYIQTCAKLVPWHRHSVVGFSSTFQQNTASLALARNIKGRFPNIKVVMGGANFDGEMGVEYARAFPWIDYAVIGEGDEIFPKLARALVAGEQVPLQPGLTVRTETGVAFFGPAPMVTDLKTSPPPDYDEYFEAGNRMNLLRGWEGAKYIRVPFESSRGCWWGERNHCTFCGLNANGMKFRAKSAPQVLKELTYLSERYKWSKFDAVDNIMDRDFLEGLCGSLAEMRNDLDIFYEVKANMSRAEIHRLRLAGIRDIQPGIESLSSHILKLMKKGIKGIHNLEMLKWAQYYGVQVQWNILTGFPGEQIENITQQIEWIKAIPHFPPPLRCSQIWLERFSPYYTHREAFPVKNVRPGKSYSFVYPPGSVDLAQIAYFFDYEMGDTLPAGAWKPLIKEVAKWRAKWNGKGNHPSLTYTKTSGRLLISDTRSDETPTVHEYSGPLAELYCFCETRRPLEDCLKFLQRFQGTEAATDHFLQQAIDDFASRQLMIRENDVVLGLALPENRPC